MAIGMLRQMGASHRDATSAYLQALLDVKPGVINLVEFPRSWWPWSWFQDDAMTIPTYKRPVVPLVYALPGHPKSGNVREEHAEPNPGQVGLEEDRGLERCVRSFRLVHHLPLCG